MPRKVGFVLGQVWTQSNRESIPPGTFAGTTGGISRHIVCLHGAESHSGWFGPFARHALATGVWEKVFATDREGWRGDVRSMDSGFSWIQACLERARSSGDAGSEPLSRIDRRSDSKIDVVATSWGALAALAFFFDGPVESWRQVESLHLVAPGIFPHKKLQRRILWRTVADSFTGGGFISGRLPLTLVPSDFSEQPEIISWIAADALRNAHVSLDFLKVTAAFQKIVRNRVIPGSLVPDSTNARPIVSFHVPSEDPVIDLPRTKSLIQQSGADIIHYDSRRHGLLLQHPDLLAKAMACQKSKAGGIP